MYGKPIWSRILGSIWSDVVVIIATLCIRHTSLILNSRLNPTVRLTIMLHNLCMTSNLDIRFDTRGSFVSHLLWTTPSFYMLFAFLLINENTKF